MRLIIDDTDNLSEGDIRILEVLLEEGEEEEETVSAADSPLAQDIKTAVNRAVAEKAKPAPAAKPKPEPEPEPMAEEALPDEDEEDEGLPEEQEEEDEEVSNEELLKLAVSKARDMVSSGKAPEVRKALDVAGASRVRELNADNVRAFFKALP